MSRTRMVLLRIAGSVVGLAVGVAVGVALFSCLHLAYPPGDDFFLVGLGILCSAVLGTVGAAAGATVTQKLLKQRSSFWRALLGAVAGMVLGQLCALSVFGVLAVPILIGAGAVIGSGWKARPVDAQVLSSHTEEQS